MKEILFIPINLMKKGKLEESDNLSKSPNSKYKSWDLNSFDNTLFLLAHMGFEFEIQVKGHKKE